MPGRESAVGHRRTFPAMTAPIAFPLLVKSQKSYGLDVAETALAAPAMPEPFPGLPSANSGPTEELRLDIPLPFLGLPLVALVVASQSKQGACVVVDSPAPWQMP